MTPFTTRRRRFQAALLATLLPLIGFAQGTAPTGSGTAGDPYIIDSADDLVYLSALSAGNTTYLEPSNLAENGPFYYEQTTDIDLTGAAFNGIKGGYNNEVSWHYDGKGHAISNMNLNLTDLFYLGFIHDAKSGSMKNVTFQSPVVILEHDDHNASAAVVYGQAKEVTIDNVKIFNPTVSSTCSILSSSYATNAAGMVATSNSPEVISITNSFISGGTISAIAPSAQRRLGGFIGNNSNTMRPEINRCEVHNLNLILGGSSTASTHMGGVIAYVSVGGPTSVTNCLVDNLDFDAGTSTDFNFGGLIGYLNFSTGGSGNVSKNLVHSITASTAEGDQGAFIGSSSSFSDFKWNVSTATPAAVNAFSNPINGTNNLVEATEVQLGDLSTYTSRNWAFPSDWRMNPLTNYPMLRFAKVSAGNPKTIASTEVLYAEHLVLDDDITILADDSGYGQLKADTIFGTGQITVQQYTATEGWTMVSPPVSASVASIGDNVGTFGANSDANVSSWNTTTYGWADETAEDFTAGKGYVAYLGANGVSSDATGPWTLELTGAVNTSVTPSLAYTTYDAETSAWSTFESTSGSAANGWNLVGNPFPCALDLSTVSFSNVNAAAYVYSNGSYVPLTAGADYYIAPMQSFFVQATDAGTPSMGTLTMSANCNTAQAPAFRDVMDQIVLVASGDGATSDDLVYPMRDDATLDFEGAYDAWHLGNGNGKVNLFSLENGEAYAVNATAPVYGMHQQWTVAFRHDAAGTFELSLDESYLLEERTLEVEDPATGALHNLFDGPMSFEYSTPGENLTFVLHVDRVGDLPDAEAFSAAEGAAGAANSVDALEATEEALQVVVTADGIQIALNADGNWAGSLFDAQGRNVMDIQSNGRGQWQEGLASIPAGSYLLHLQNTDGEQPALQTRFIKQ